MCLIVLDGASLPRQAVAHSKAMKHGKALPSTTKYGVGKQLINEKEKERGE